MTLSELKQKIEAAKIRAYGLKTKAAQKKAWSLVRDLEREALIQLYDQRAAYETYSARATVRWFNEGDDTVALRLEDGTTVHGSPTSDVVSKSWYGSTCCVEYTEGQVVVVEFEVDVDSDRLCLFLVPRRIHGGTLNETRYAELSKRDDLAFFKYPNQTGMTGLFKGVSK